jgi:uncharacterized membrane protein YhhN
MRKYFLGFIGLLAAIAVLLTLAGLLLRHPLLADLFKPLATVLILSVALSQWRLNKIPYSRWITIGLFFSLIGDIALLWPNSRFLLGLAAFLVTHAAYLIAFTRDAKLPARVSIWFVYLAIAAAMLVFLFPNLPSSLKIPIALYSLLLASMAAQAMGRFLILETRPARLAAIGAILFMLSDLLLAFDHFHSAIPLAPVLVLSPYYVGQWLIACSTAPVEPTQISKSGGDIAVNGRS